MRRITIASPIRQKSEILDEFFKCFKMLDTEGLDIDYHFIDDNVDIVSTTQIMSFRNTCGKECVISDAHNDVDIPYICDDFHRWNLQLMNKVALFKNAIIERAKSTKRDVFFVDSDLLIHPKTLKTLIWRDKDIVSEVFWTSWQPNESQYPNAWIMGQYGISREFLTALRQPGCYKVGGLGALTLIKNEALQKGCNFSKVGPVDYTGEDRHFCIRASILGFELWVDTTLPALHLYRDEDLSKVKAFYESI